MNKELLESAILIRDSDQYETDFWYQGNFVTCTIQDKETRKVLSVGVSKCNPADNYKEELGSRIAFIRAVRGMESGWETFNDNYRVSLVALKDGRQE